MPAYAGKVKKLPSKQLFFALGGSRQIHSKGAYELLEDILDEVFARISHSSDDFDLLFECEGNEGLLFLVGVSEQRIVNVAAACLLELSRHEQQQVDLVTADGVQVLLPLLASASDECLPSFLGVLLNLAQVREARMALSNGVGTLKSLLSGDAKSRSFVHRSAVSLLGLLGEDPSCWPHLVDAQLVRPLLRLLLASKDDAGLVENVLWVFTHLITQPRVVADVQGNGGIRILVHLITSPSSDTTLLQGLSLLEQLCYASESRVLAIRANAPRVLLDVVDGPHKGYARVLALHLLTLLCQGGRAVDQPPPPPPPGGGGGGGGAVDDVCACPKGVLPVLVQADWGPRLVRLLAGDGAEDGGDEDAMGVRHHAATLLVHALRSPRDGQRIASLDPPYPPPSQSLRYWATLLRDQVCADAPKVLVDALLLPATSSEQFDQLLDTLHVCLHHSPQGIDGAREPLIAHQERLLGGEHTASVLNAWQRFVQIDVALADALSSQKSLMNVFQVAIDAITNDTAIGDGDGEDVQCSSFSPTSTKKDVSGEVDDEEHTGVAEHMAGLAMSTLVEMTHASEALIRWTKLGRSLLPLKKMLQHRCKAISGPSSILLTRMKCLSSGKLREKSSSPTTPQRDLKNPMEGKLDEGRDEEEKSKRSDGKVGEDGEKQLVDEHRVEKVDGGESSPHRETTSDALASLAASLRNDVEQREEKEEEEEEEEDEKQEGNLLPPPPANMTPPSIPSIDALDGSVDNEDGADASNGEEYSSTTKSVRGDVCRIKLHQGEDIRVLRVSWSIGMEDLLEKIGKRIGGMDKIGRIRYRDECGDMLVLDDSIGLEDAMDQARSTRVLSLHIDDPSVCETTSSTVSSSSSSSSSTTSITPAPPAPPAPSASPPHHEALRPSARAAPFVPDAKLFSGVKLQLRPASKDNPRTTRRVRKRGAADDRQSLLDALIDAMSSRRTVIDTSTADASSLMENGENEDEVW